MTKETKIGLLVGLAFIIVFAIILSEKGPTARTTSVPAFTLGQTARPSGAIDPAQPPLNRAGRLPVDSRLPPIVQPAIGINPTMPMREEEVVQVAEASENDLPPLPQSVISLINGTLPPAAESTPSGAAQADTARPADLPIESTTLAQASGQNDSTAQSNPAQNQPAAPASESIATGISNRSEPTTIPVAAGSAVPTIPTGAATTEGGIQTKYLAIKTVHVVEKGESLGKIAAKFYGRSSPERVEALYEVNRDKLQSLHSVKAGQKLKIPDLGPASSEFEPASPFAGRPHENSTEAPLPASASPPSSPDRGTGAELAIRIPTPLSDAPSGRGTDGSALRQVSQPQNATSASGVPTTRDQSAYRWYEVKPSDTLSRIARKELGSERLFGEIYRLNKDVIADKNRLKPGMKIRLPQPSAATMTSDSMITIGRMDDDQ